jgi:hypothetical protein
MSEEVLICCESKLTRHGFIRISVMHRLVSFGGECGYHRYDTTGGRCVNNSAWRVCVREIVRVKVLELTSDHVKHITMIARRRQCWIFLAFGESFEDTHSRACITDALEDY